MAIQTNPLNDQGLAALANMRAIDLNLPLHGVDVSGATKPLFEMKMAQMQQQNDLARQFLANQGALNVAQQQGSNAINLAQNVQQPFEASQNALNRQQRAEEMRNTNAYQMGLLKNDATRTGIEQQQANTAQAAQQATAQYQIQDLQNRQQMQKQDLAYKTMLGNLALTKEQRDVAGGLGASALLAYKYASSPEELAKIITQTKQTAQSNNIDPTTIPSDPQQFVSWALTSTGAAGNAQFLANQGLYVGPSMTTKQANGQPQAVMRMPLNQAQKSTTLSDLQNIQGIINQAETAQKAYQPAFAQYTNEAQTSMGGWLAGKVGIPLPTSLYSKDLAEKMGTADAALGTLATTMVGNTKQLRSAAGLGLGPVLMGSMPDPQNDDPVKTNAKLQNIVNQAKQKYSQLSDNYYNGVEVNPNANQ